MKYFNEILLLFGKRLCTKNIDFVTYIKYMKVIQKREKRKQNTRLYSNSKKKIKIDTTNIKPARYRKPPLFLKWMIAKSPCFVFVISTVPLYITESLCSWTSQPLDLNIWFFTNSILLKLVWYILKEFLLNFSHIFAYEESKSQLSIH